MRTAFTFSTLIFVFVCRYNTQALDIVKQAKVASILADGDRRKSNTSSTTGGSSGKEKPSRRGSRESLDMTYDGEEVSSEQDKEKKRAGDEKNASGK